MARNYQFVLLKKPNVLSEQCFTVAYIKDKKTNIIVLIVDVVVGLMKNEKQECCFVKELEAENLPGNFYGLVWIDARTFVEQVMNSPENGEVMMMHELGHYKLGHHKMDKYVENYSEVRKNYDGVMPQEYEADEFAIRECGINRFVQFIDKTIEIRRSYTFDKNRDKAIREYELRKVHGIEYSKTFLRNNNS